VHIGAQSLQAGILLATATALFGASADPARAAFAYAFSDDIAAGSVSTPEGVSGVSPQTTNVSSFSGFGTDGPVSAPLDAPQTFVGPAVAAPQNFFGQYGTGVGQYARADSLIGEGEEENVAEVFRASVGFASSYATIAVTFTLGSGLNCL